MAGSENLGGPDAMNSRSSINVNRLRSFSAVFLVGLLKSKTIQQRLNLLMKSDIFSEAGASLKGKRGSIPAMTLDGKTADDVLLGALGFGDALFKLVVL